MKAASWNLCSTWCCWYMLAWVDTSAPSSPASVIVSYCLQRQFGWWAVEQAASNLRVSNLSVYLLLHKVVFELLKRSFQASWVPSLLKLSSRAKPSSQHNSWPDGMHFFLRKLLSGEKKKPLFPFLMCVTSVIAYSMELMVGIFSLLLLHISSLHSISMFNQVQGLN